eukprot:6134145-Amphidinium_carterae.3
MRSKAAKKGPASVFLENVAIASLQQTLLCTFSKNLSPTVSLEHSGCLWYSMKCSARCRLEFMPGDKGRARPVAEPPASLGDLFPPKAPAQRNFNAAPR